MLQHNFRIAMITRVRQMWEEGDFIKRFFFEEHAGDVFEFLMQQIKDQSKDDLIFKTFIRKHHFGTSELEKEDVIEPLFVLNMSVPIVKINLVKFIKTEEGKLDFEFDEHVIIDDSEAVMRNDVSDFL